MNEGLVLIIAGLLAIASLSVQWNVRKERQLTGDKGQHFWLWLAHSLSLTGLTCSVLMIASLALYIVLPEIAQQISGPMVAMSAGIWFGFLGDRSNARKK